MGSGSGHWVMAVYYIKDLFEQYPSIQENVLLGWSNHQVDKQELKTLTSQTWASR